jgi:UDP-glucose 4-epimerase
MARFLITGGAGFIGSHLCEALIERGHKAAVLDNLSSGKFENLPEEAEFFPGDVSDAAAVRHAMRGADGVFHLAAVASVEKCNLAWRAAHQTNLFGSVTVFISPGVRLTKLTFSVR